MPIITPCPAQYPRSHQYFPPVFITGYGNHRRLKSHYMHYIAIFADIHFINIRCLAFWNWALGDSQTRKRPPEELPWPGCWDDPTIGHTKFPVEPSIPRSILYYGVAVRSTTVQQVSLHIAGLDVPSCPFPASSLDFEHPQALPICNVLSRRLKNQYNTAVVSNTIRLSFGSCRQSSMVSRSQSRMA